MKTCCVVVIGHVDHGKTAVVRALTGTETDRLPEEKARGLSITPGFAHKTYSSGTIDFVDAPGHVDFIHAMVSGATGAQAALIVISSVEGIQAQTLEHLRIAELLGIKDAVIALSKADLLPQTELDAQVLAIRTAFAPTPFSNAPIIACSAMSGHGVEALNEALNTMLHHAPAHHDAQHCFLPIDRVFTLPGRGTIVTGTLLGQRLSTDTALTLHPAGRDITLRGLQSRGAERDHIQAGERTAANLRGVAVTDVARGMVLCAKGTGDPSTCIDVKLSLLHAPGAKLKHMSKVRVLFGTSSEVAQIRLIQDDTKASTYAQLRFPKPVVCFAGQRAILRRLSPPETLGGATVLDPAAQAGKVRSPDRLCVLEAAQQRDVILITKALCKAGNGVAKVADISRLARLNIPKTEQPLGDHFVPLDPDWITTRNDIALAETALLHALSNYHQQHPLQTMAPNSSLGLNTYAPRLMTFVVETLLARRDVRRTDNMLALARHDPVALLDKAQRAVMDDIENTYRHAGLTPPTPNSLRQAPQASALQHLLTEAGRLIVLQNIALNQSVTLHADTISAALGKLAAAFPPPQAFTTSQARTALNTTRRVIVPLLEHSDSLG